MSGEGSSERLEHLCQCGGELLRLLRWAVGISCVGAVFAPCCALSRAPNALVGLSLARDGEDKRKIEHPRPTNAGNRSPHRRLWTVTKDVECVDSWTAA